jgi:hypothetical protein
MRGFDPKLFEVLAETVSENRLRKQTQTRIQKETHNVLIRERNFECVKAEMSNPEIPGPGPEETSLPDWYQLFLEERLETQDSTILELTQKFEDMETQMRQVLAPALLKLGNRTCMNRFCLRLYRMLRW